MTTGKGDVEGMDTKAMQGMEGMKGMQPGAVAIPASHAQLIGVRTVPVGYALWNRRSARSHRGVRRTELTKVICACPAGSSRCSSMRRPVGPSCQPLLTLYSPDLLATKTSTVAVKARAQLEGSPVAEARQQSSRAGGQR